MSDSPPAEIMQTEPTGGLVEQRSVASPRQPSHRPTFQITCWLLAIIAFLQLVTIGTALTVKMGNRSSAVTVAQPYISPVTQPVVPRTLDEIMSGLQGVLPSGLEISTEEPPLALVPLSPPLLTEFTAPPSKFPLIADPQVERLVQESRKLSMNGDMIRALRKLDEAEKLDPTEPAVMFHKAGLYESMSYYVKAGDQYEKIQQMGVKAGVYFKHAARKLTEGMDTADSHRDTLSIKTMHARKIEGPHGCRASDVTIAISARPDTPINADDVEVNIYFYDSINGEKIETSSATAIVKKSWVNTVQTWNNVGNEESLSVSYKIPDSDYTDEYLFGKREYYGFVVELVYKGEVIDQRAKPRMLHNRHRDSFSPMNNNSQPWFPENGDSLLPSLSNDGLPSYVLPPLPSRR